MPTLPRMPLGLRILIHTPGRLAVSITGVLLAVVLMFSQSGFRNGMFDSQTELIRRLNGNLFIVSSLRYLIFASEPFASRRLNQVQACPGVRTAYPLYLETAVAFWQKPIETDSALRQEQGSSTRPIRVLAFDPDQPVFDLPEVAAHAQALKMPDTVLFDEKSRDFYGQPRAGTVAALSGHKVTVVGTFRLGTDFLTDGNVIMSDRNFLKLFPDPASPTPHLNKVQIGVVRLVEGADLRTVQRDLQGLLPADVKVLTQQELVNLELEYWETNTAIGYIFRLGMGVGFIIGMVICYQILYANVSNYLPQFATLKAMGFKNSSLVGIVLQQGFFLAVLGFVPAVAAAQLLFWVVGSLTGLLMFLTPPRVAFILVLTVAMCMVSGILAVRRVVRADPAEVFR